MGHVPNLLLWDIFFFIFYFLPVGSWDRKKGKRRSGQWRKVYIVLVLVYRLLMIRIAKHSFTIMIRIADVTATQPPIYRNWNAAGFHSTPHCFGLVDSLLAREEWGILHLGWIFACGCGMLCTVDIREFYQSDMNKGIRPLPILMGGYLAPFLIFPFLCFFIRVSYLKRIRIMFINSSGALSCFAFC